MFCSDYIHRRRLSIGGYSKIVHHANEQWWQLKMFFSKTILTFWTLLVYIRSIVNEGLNIFSMFGREPNPIINYYLDDEHIIIISTYVYVHRRLNIKVLESIIYQKWGKDKFMIRKSKSCVLIVYNFYCYWFSTNTFYTYRDMR